MQLDNEILIKISKEIQKIPSMSSVELSLRENELIFNCNGTVIVFDSFGKVVGGQSSC